MRRMEETLEFEEWAIIASDFEALTALSADFGHSLWPWRRLLWPVDDSGLRSRFFRNYAIFGVILENFAYHLKLCS